MGVPKLETVDQESEIMMGRIEAKVIPHLLEEEVMKSMIFLDVPILEQIEQFAEAVVLLQNHDVLMDWLQILTKVSNRFNAHMEEMRMYYDLEYERSKGLTAPYLSVLQQFEGCQ